MAMPPQPIFVDERTSAFTHHFLRPLPMRHGIKLRSGIRTNLSEYDRFSRNSIDVSGFLYETEAGYFCGTKVYGEEQVCERERINASLRYIIMFAVHCRLLRSSSFPARKSSITACKYSTKDARA